MANPSREFAAHLLLITILTLFSIRSGQNCAVPLKPKPDRYFPLIVSRSRGILDPRKSRAVSVQPGETIDIVCPGNGNKLSVGQTFVTTLCLGTGQFSNLTQNFSFQCNSKIAVEVVEPGLTCGSLGGSKIIKIQFPVTAQGDTHEVTTVCFNEAKLTTEYSKHTLRGSGMRYKDSGKMDRPEFKTDKYFSRLNPLMSTVYKKQQTKQTLAKLLGNATLADAYINGWGSESYLARGHLSPDKDYSLITMQDATYHYINAVPMWQAFNNGNWKDLEGYVRTASTRPTPRDLTIFTGTSGILKLQDAQRNWVDIYLWVGGANRFGVPVPQLIWKAVYDEQRKQGVVFIMLNHPNNPTYPIPDPPLLCPDVCSNITWVPWNNRNDRNKGMIYCCTVDSFASSGFTIPSVGYSLMV